MKYRAAFIKDGGGTPQVLPAGQLDLVYDDGPKVLSIYLNGEWLYSFKPSGKFAALSLELIETVDDAIDVNWRRPSNTAHSRIFQIAGQGKANPPTYAYMAAYSQRIGAAGLTETSYPGYHEFRTTREGDTLPRNPDKGGTQMEIHTQDLSRMGPTGIAIFPSKGNGVDTVRAFVELGPVDAQGYQTLRVQNISGAAPAPAPAPTPAPSPTGTNLITNGGFDSPTGWLPEPGWTISGGKAHHTATPSALRKSVSGLVNGASYRVTWKIDPYSAGVFYTRFEGGVMVRGPYHTAAGVFQDTLIATSGNNILAFVGNSDGVGSIDDVVLERM